MFLEMASLRLVIIIAFMGSLLRLHCGAGQFTIFVEYYKNGKQLGY